MIDKSLIGLDAEAVNANPNLGLVDRIHGAHCSETRRV
jgi:hypothetical protein